MITLYEMIISLPDKSMMERQHQLTFTFLCMDFFFYIKKNSLGLNYYEPQME